MRTALILVVAFFASSAGATEQRIPLPELTGAYELRTFHDQLPVDPPSTRTVAVRTGIAMSDLTGLRIEMTGSIFAGAAVGDGVFRRPVAVPLRGSFAPNVEIGNAGMGWFVTREEIDGPLEKVFDHSGPLYLPSIGCLGGCDPNWPTVRSFDPVITLGLDPATSSFMDVGYIDVPAEPIFLPDLRGINITAPMRGQITSAFLVVQSVPEPGNRILLCLTVVLLGLSSNAIVRQQSRHQYSSGTNRRDSSVA